jgi:hypothetical protein
MFGNKVLRKIFGPEMDGISGKFKTMYNKELHDL